MATRRVNAMEENSENSDIIHIGELKLVNELDAKETNCVWPEIWFYQVEAQFQISRISLEETKFHYLVSQLELKYVENIWDIVNSKSDTKYTDSKNRLLSLFKDSENLRIKRLLTGIELGDMKPSQLLQKLKTVATSNISDNLIKTLWLEKLPESIKIFWLSTGEATSSRDQLLLDRIQSLEEQICQLSILHKSRTKERNSFRPKSRSRSRKRFDPKGKYCYFHFRFGARCKPEKCCPPCAWNRNTENFSLQ
ncbi:uncharacterized protein TNCV_483081 [Trichonephila clavipes]|uniref:DUF7041 domain-containing protein n=1 Tax=Trichonephila clavipes TaxID=2585209 RepID=A0A8X6UVL7_TRICX|nr:uncharacterized protein TNCV_483081 [Trichonephila clavipes]